MIVGQSGHCFNISNKNMAMLPWPRLIEASRTFFALSKIGQKELANQNSGKRFITVKVELFMSGREYLSLEREMVALLQLRISEYLTLKVG